MAAGATGSARSLTLPPPADHTRTSVGAPSTCRRRLATPPRTRITPSGALRAGSRTGHRGRTSTSTEVLTSAAEDVNVDQEGATGDDPVTGAAAPQTRASSRAGGA